MNSALYRAKPKDQTDYDYLSQAFPDKCKDGFVYGQMLIDDKRERYYICVAIVAMMNCTVANGTVTVIEVIPETICQYAGFQDVNKINVFDKDILKFYHQGSRSIFAVVRCGFHALTNQNENNTEFGFYLDWINKYLWLRQDIGYWVNKYPLKIAGNVFDNSELLEDEK